MNNSGPIETQLSVMNWNLWWQFGPWQSRAPAIEATIKAADPDLITLQEVWGVAAENHAKQLANALGYHVYFEQCMTMNKVGFGNAILSRWPIAEAKALQLSGYTETSELRKALYAKINGPRGDIHLFCTHLNWRYEQSHIRQEQVQEVAGFVKANSHGKMPPILCGDFNAEPMSDEIRSLTGLATSATEGLVFHDAWATAGAGEGYTWNVENPYSAEEFEPNRRIDYIFTGHPKARGRGHVTKIGLIGNAPVEGTWPSDHIGLLAKIRY